MRAAAVVASILSVLSAACILIPAPNLTLLPFTVAAPELAHWLMLFDLLGLILAIGYYRPAIVFALGSLCVAAWPVVEARKLHQLGKPLTFSEVFRTVESGRIEPERLPLNILCYRSMGAGPHPVIVDIYGGSWQRGSPWADAAFDMYMASRGYAVFAIDYRHAPQFVYPAQLEDVRAALSFIHSHAAGYDADPGRIALYGRSAGGQLALRTAYDSGPIPIRAVISLYGPSNLLRGYRELPSPDPIDVRLTLSTYIGGTPAQALEKFRDASPFNLAQNLVPPTLLVQGGRDHIVKPEFARALFEKLTAAGNQAYLLEIPWAEHSFDEVFSGLGNQVALRYIEGFLEAALELKSGITPRKP